MKDFFDHTEVILQPNTQKRQDDVIVCFKYTIDSMNLYNLAQSYFESAKQLNMDSMHAEWYCYPILFCYRQYLELMLKDLFNKYYKLWRYKFLNLSNLKNKPIDVMCATQKKEFILKIFEDIKLIVKHPNKNFKDLENEINNFNVNDIEKSIDKLIKDNPKKYEVLNIIKDLCVMQCKFNDLHSLERYLSLAAIFIKYTFPDILKEKNYKTFEKLILDFHTLDSSSMSFRYPFTKQGNNTEIQNFFEESKNTIKAKSIFGEFEFNKYQTVDFKYLKNTFNKIDDYFIHLGSAEFNLNSAYDKIVELLCGNYYKAIFGNYPLSFYDVKQAKKQFDEAINVSSEIKPEFIKVLDEYKNIFDKIFDLFEKYKPNYVCTNELSFVKDRVFAENDFAYGSLLNNERKKMKKQSLILKKIYKKYLKNINQFEC